MNMPLAHIQNHLLELLANQPARARQLSEHEWHLLFKLAQRHRLIPLLHWQLKHYHAHISIPATLLEQLANGYRKSTLRALSLGAAFSQIVQTLSAANIECLALKGAYLAFHVYPQAGLRPMRDLDLLVPDEQAIEAFQCLQNAGFRQASHAQGSAEDWRSKHRHLPPLIKAGGICVELHTRVHEHDTADQLRSEWLCARAIQVNSPSTPPMTVLSPIDQLLHLIVHSIYQHRLDNGPLVISDIALLLQQQPIDWPLFWALADQGGYRPGCQLLLALTCHAWPELRLPMDSNIIALPEKVMQAARQLLFRNYQLRQDTHFLYLLNQQKHISGKLRLLSQSLFPSGEMLRSSLGAPTSPLAGYMMRWRRFFGQRLPEHLSAWRNPQLREEIHQLVTVEQWLEHQALTQGCLHR